MKQFLLEHRFILLFFVILTGVTVFSNIDFENKKLSAQPDIKMIYEQGPGVSAANRSPAAVRPSLALKKEILCKGLHPGLRERINDQLVMIDFRTCREDTGLQTVKLENKTNGFRAQIFRMADGSFKTDYIQLNEGLNQLKFEVVLKDGQKLEESLEILSDLNSKQ